MDRLGTSILLGMLLRVQLLDRVKGIKIMAFHIISSL